MGDIGTHAKIADLVIALLQGIRPNEEYIFFELGNWFTDTSQLRDPFAHISGKKVIWDAAVQTAHEKSTIAKMPLVAEAALDLSYDLDRYLDELMGLPGPAGGLLAAYFLHFFFIDGCEKFHRQGVEPNEFEELFAPPTTERAGAPVAIMTQYYPHEHMDFPPWPVHSIVGERNPSQSLPHLCPLSPSGGGGRKLYQYTEDQLVYLSDSFTLVEQRWARRPSREGETDQQKRDRHYLLTRFGHASHALEDFFFHSNFTECAWKMLDRPLPPQDSAPSSESRDHAEDEMNPAREKRFFFRRLRAPRGKGETLDAQASDLLDQIFTGYFASGDMFHTIMDAIQGIMARAQQTGHLPKFMMEMLAGLLEPVEGADEEQRKERQKERNRQHRERLKNGTYVQMARAAEASGKLHPKSVRRIELMCQIDLNLWNKYEKVDLGVYGMIMQLLDKAKKEHAESDRHSRKLDEQQNIDPNVEHDVRTNNGASAENIGSHTLMAKDSVRKRPLRQQAFNLAAAAALYAARRMVEDPGKNLPVARSTNAAPGGPDGGALNTKDVKNIDWLHLLQHLVCHPSEAERLNDIPWWQIQFEKPDFTKIGHNTKFIDDAIAQQRMQERMRSQLEAKYNALAEDAEREWHSMLGSLRHAEVGALIGGIALGALGAVAGAMAGAALGGMLGPAGAIVGGIVGGILGFIAGAVLGALVGGGIGSLF